MDISLFWDPWLYQNSSERKMFHQTCFIFNLNISKNIQLSHLNKDASRTVFITTSLHLYNIIGLNFRKIEKNTETL